MVAIVNNIIRFKDYTSGRTSNGVKNQKGFTLIELLVVIAILIVGLTVAGSQYNRYIQNYNLRTEASTLRGHLQEASSLARARSQSCDVVFDIGEDRYGISAGGEIIKIYNFTDSRVRLVSADFSGGQVLRYESRGTVIHPGTNTHADGVVILRNALESTATVTISNPFGKISIKFDLK